MNRCHVRYFAVGLTIASATLLGLLGTAPRRAEVARIRAHLARVEDQLRTADVSHLTVEQRAARAHHLRVLNEYRARGVFPHNHTGYSGRLPVFVDEHGTQCAVGYLIARAGRGDIVDRIATTRNYATVPELADDAQLGTWLTQAGLTVEEAAQIQPQYGPVVEFDNHAGYTTASLIGTALGGGMIAWNVLLNSETRSRTMPGVLGLGVGILEMALGAGGLAQHRDSDDDIPSGHVLINFGVGAASSLLGILTLTDSRRPGAPAEPNAARSEVHWQVTPWAPVPDQVGVKLNVRF